MSFTEVEKTSGCGNRRYLYNFIKYRTFEPDCWEKVLAEAREYNAEVDAYHQNEKDVKIIDKLFSNKWRWDSKWKYNFITNRHIHPESKQQHEFENALREYYLKLDSNKTD